MLRAFLSLILFALISFAAPVKPVPPPGITLADADKKPLETGLNQLRKAMPPQQAPVAPPVKQS